jgi:triacylglycerol lipase
VVKFSLIREYAQKAEDVYLGEEALRKKYPSALIKTISHLDVQFFIETDDKQKVYYISVRGTANFENFKVDSEIVKIYNEKLGGHFHHGFIECANSIYWYLPSLRKDYEIRLTGHSLGGAIATILMMILMVDGFRLGKTITFGAPKICNRKTVLKFHDADILRIVNDEDPVPYLPPTTFFTWWNNGLFRQLGEEILLFPGEKFKVISRRKAERIGLSSLWLHLLDLEINSHYIKAYQSNLFLKQP